MLFVHFTPKRNVKGIKRRGLRPGSARKGVRLFPLLRDLKTVVNQWDRPLWWRRGTAKRDKPTAKIVVRLPPEARVHCGDWINFSKGWQKDVGDGITVRKLGEILAAERRNPYWNPAVPKGGRPDDLPLLKRLAEYEEERSGGWVKAETLLNRWLSGRIMELEPEFKSIGGLPETIFGFEVAYLGSIPKGWIVKILDRSNTDTASRGYRRSARRKRAGLDGDL